MRRQAVTRKDLWMVGSPSRCQASLNPCGSWGCAPGPAAAAASSWPACRAAARSAGLGRGWARAPGSSTQGWG